MSVIICGAGVVGLCLAHGLKRAQIPFAIYERDAHIDARPHGWAITLHWALPYLRELLDDDTLAAIDAVQVDPDMARCDTGNFLFLNLATLDAKFRIPPNERRRVSRERLRKALLRGVADHVHWGKRLVAVELVHDDDGDDGAAAGVRALFEDGHEARGSLLVGAEGSSSRTREFLVPDGHANQSLPVKLIGAAVDLTPDEAASLRAIDPLLFQGCHPDTGHFLWVSLLETPDTNGSRATPAERYRVQVMVSWLVKDAAADQVPSTDAARLAEMRRRAAGFHARLRALVDAIPASAPVTEIALQDWPCRAWHRGAGRVTLVGDAAHAMTMYRGEAANHGILDAVELCRALARARARGGGPAEQRRAVDEYEAEMVRRAAPAVLLSRQACLDAHDFHRLNEDSAVLKKRAIQAE